MTLLRWFGLLIAVQKGQESLTLKQRQTLDLLTYNLMRAVGEEKESR